MRLKDCYFWKPLESEPQGDQWALRHFKNRRDKPQDKLESPRNAVFAPLAMMIGFQRVVPWWRLGFDMATLGPGVPSVLAIDLPTDRVVLALFKDVVKIVVVEKDTEDFILSKQELPLVNTMAPAILTANKINIRYTQAEE